MLCMDTTIFILTLAKTIRVRSHMQHGIQRVLFRDGEHSRIPAEMSKFLNTFPGIAYYGYVHWKVRSAPSRIDTVASVLVIAGAANLLTFMVSSALGRDPLVRANRCSGATRK